MPLTKKTTEKIRIGDLIEYENNNKNHTDKSIKVTKESIEKFWYTTSIEVDEQNVILAWHGRKKALLASWKTEDDTIEVTRLTWYTDKEKAEYRIISNIAADQAAYNIENIELEVQKYDLWFVGEYFKIDLDVPEVESTGEVDEDDLMDDDACECPKCGFKFTP